MANTIPDELLRALSEYLRTRTYSRPSQREAFLNRLFDAPSTITDLCKVANLSTGSARAWRKHVLDYCKEAGVTLPHYFHNRRGRPPTNPPASTDPDWLAELEDGIEDSSTQSAPPLSASPSPSGERGDTPSTRNTGRSKTERRKPFVDNDTFRALVDDMVEDAHSARDHKAFSAVGKLKVEVTPGLKVPDTHLNINISYLGPKGLDALNGLLLDRVARLIAHRDQLPPELRMLLPEREEAEELISIGPVSHSSTDEAGREVVDTDAEIEEIVDER